MCRSGSSKLITGTGRLDVKPQRQRRTDQVGHGIQPHHVSIDAVRQLLFPVGFHAFHVNRQQENQAGDDKGGDKKGVQEGEITQAGKVVADGEVKSDEQQQISPGDIDALAIVAQEEPEPGNEDNDQDGQEDPVNVVVEVPRRMEAEGKARGREVPTSLNPSSSRKV
jgi:hypothetical protein